MAKKKHPRRASMPNRKLTMLERAEKSLALIAAREGTSVELIKKQIQIGMMFGLLNNDPKVKAEWNRIPCEGEIPTPEEIIASYADKLSNL